jgi:hypothetical protein
MSVVDGSLKVYGIENLRIADGSIMPRVITGNTMASCVIIGERASDLLRTAHKLSEVEAHPDQGVGAVRCFGGAHEACTPTVGFTIASQMLRVERPSVSQSGALRLRRLFKGPVTPDCPQFHFQATDLVSDLAGGTSGARSRGRSFR